MTLIDTHCHLYSDEFAVDQAGMIARAVAEGVEAFYLPSIDSTATTAMLELENSHPDRVFAMMGLHPCSVKENYAAELLFAEEWLEKRSFAGIGETGLDFYWDTSFVKQQYDAFRKQVEWAKKFNVPVIIHARKATQECIDVIKEMQDGQLRGIFHCFGGTADEAHQIIHLGFTLGIGGVITYKNAGLAEVVATLPLSNIVLETDAPYLAPVPFRGKRNESAYLKYIAQKVADVKQLPVTEIAAITTANANKMFGRAQAQ